MRRAIAKQSRVRTVGNGRRPPKRRAKAGLCRALAPYLPSRRLARVYEEVKVTGPRPRHEIATDVDDIRADLEFERQELESSIRHDYSTSGTGIVPLDRRRPMWHFAGLWTTFAAGLSFLFLGFELHHGNSIAPVIAITVLGYVFYMAHAKFGAYLGSRIRHPDRAF